MPEKTENTAGRVAQGCGGSEAACTHLGCGGTRESFLHSSWHGGTVGWGRHTKKPTLRDRHTDNTDTPVPEVGLVYLILSPLSRCPLSPLGTARTYPLKVSQFPQTAGTTPWGSGCTFKSLSSLPPCWPGPLSSLPSLVPSLCFSCSVVTCHMGIATVVSFWSLSNHRTSYVFPLGPVTMLFLRS